MDADTKNRLIHSLHDAHFSLAELGQRLPDISEDDVNAVGAYERVVLAVEDALTLLGDDFGSPLIATEED